jgi:CHRD domain
MRRSLFGVLVLSMAVTAALVAAEKYQVHISPMPFSDATLPDMRGKGTASATLDGETLSIAGTFAGLASPATRAHLLLSRGPGIPGTAIFDLVVSPDTAGKLSGQVKLQPNQIAALKTGKLYVQIDTEKVPTGTLWGWLLTEHEVAGQDVPQKGPWYIPPFAVKTK